MPTCTFCNLSYSGRKANHDYICKEQFTISLPDGTTAVARLNDEGKWICDCDVLAGKDEEWEDDCGLGGCTRTYTRKDKLRTHLALDKVVWIGSKQVVSILL